MTIAIVGLGYVGLPLALQFAAAVSACWASTLMQKKFPR